MNYLSLFSGIEAATVAWHPLGWTPVAFSEIDKTASKFLAETYPRVPNLGDVTKITEEMVKSLGKIDLIIFGSPCTDLSIAGKRLGLEGERSGLFRDAIRIIRWARKHCGLRFALWENVPGAYSSSKGRDFTEVVASLAGLENLDTPENGWGKEGAAIGDNGLLEWACLDAQWFGLAARRKRVFALVDFGDWESRPPILLEPESVRGDFAPSRRTGEGSSSSGAGSLGNGSHWDDPENPHPTLNQSHNAGGIGGSNQELFSQRGAYLCECVGAIDSSLGGSLPNEVIGTLLSDIRGGKPLPAVVYCTQATTIERSDTAGANGAGFSEELAFTLNTVDRHATVFRITRSDCYEEDTVASTLAARDFKSATDLVVPCAYSFDSLSSNSMKSSNPDSGCREVDLAKTLDTTTPCPSKNQGGIAILNPPIVRRLTPLECERLMGFPDGYSASMSNSQRYRTLGNSMAVPVIRYIGEKIMEALA